MTNRELDLEIATRIMGYGLYSGFGAVPQIKDPEGTWDNWENVPHYSTDLNEAFRVIEKMKERGVIISEVMITHNYPMVSMSFQLDEKQFLVRNALDESPARAICLCALRVMDEMDK